MPRAATHAARAVAASRPQRAGAHASSVRRTPRRTSPATSAPRGATAGRGTSRGRPGAAAEGALVTRAASVVAGSLRAAVATRLDTTSPPRSTAAPRRPATKRTVARRRARPATRRTVPRQSAEPATKRTATTPTRSTSRTRAAAARTPSSAASRSSSGLRAGALYPRSYARAPATTARAAAAAAAIPARAPVPAPRTTGATVLRLPIRAADGLVDRLVRGRAWVALIGVLLAGIVALNVHLIGVSGGIARMSDQATALKRQNADLRLEVAALESAERIQRVAETRGFTMPAPGQVTYVELDPASDTGRALDTLGRAPAAP